MPASRWPLDWVRAQFPALRSAPPPIFLDNPGGTQVPQTVADAVRHYLLEDNANLGGAFATSQRSDAVVAQARLASAELLGGEPTEIVFGANMTTLTFALSRALGRAWGPGDAVAVTRLDHDANVAPWLALEEKGVEVRWLDFDPQSGALDLSGLDRILDRRLRLLAVGAASNALGTVNPIPKLAEAAHGVGALLWVDAVHYAPHGPIDVRAWDCDFLVCSAYKFFGPHLGLLWGRRELLERFEPFKVRPASDAVPHRWETGTQSHEALAGLVAAVDYLSELGAQLDATATGSTRLRRAMEGIREYERDLARRLVEGAEALPARLWGPPSSAGTDGRVPTICLTSPHQPPAALAAALGELGIYAWDGNYYALSVMQRLGLDPEQGALRLGAVHYNSAAEVDEALDALAGLLRR